MSSKQRKPDPAARWTSHLVVGLAVGAAVGKKTNVAGSIVFALAAVIAHEALDAPVAEFLSELGV